MMRIHFASIALALSLALVKFTALAVMAEKAEAEEFRVAVSPGVQFTLTDIPYVLTKLAQDPDSPFSFSSESPPTSLVDAIVDDFGSVDVVIAFESEEPPAGIHRGIAYEPGRKVDVAYYVVDTVSPSAPSTPVAELGLQNLHAYPADLEDFSYNVLTECIFNRKGRQGPNVVLHDEFQQGAKLDPLIVKTFYKNRYLYYNSILSKYFLLQREVRALPYDNMLADIEACILEKQHEPIQDVEIRTSLDEVDYYVEKIIKFEQEEDAKLKAIGRFDEVRYYMKAAVKSRFVPEFFDFLYRKMEEKKIDYQDENTDAYSVESRADDVRKYAKVYELLSGKVRAILNSAWLNYGKRAEFYFKRISYGAIIARLGDRGRLTEAERVDIETAIGHYDKYFRKLAELPRPKIEFERLKAYRNLALLHFLLHNDAFVRDDVEESRKHLLASHRVIDDLSRDVQIVVNREHFPSEHGKLSESPSFMDFKDYTLGVKLMEIRATDAGV